MNSEEIKRFVEKSENAAVEFKRARGDVPAGFWPSYNSFANMDGGVSILGVREKGGRREIEGLAAEVYVCEERSVFTGDKLPFGCC